MLQIQNDAIIAQTRLLKTTIRRGFLTELAEAGGSRRPLIEPFDVDARSAVELIYADGSVADFVKGAAVTNHLLSDTCAEVRLHGWHADAVINIRICPQTGELLVRPSAYSSRPGVMSCRWNIPGVPGDLELVAPIYQGIRASLDDELLRGTHWEWPVWWEAGFVILQGAQGGFSIHTRDDRYRYKALHLPRERGSGFALDAEAYGPLDNNLAAGGLTWRVGVHQGDWQTPAKAYKQWLWQAYGLHERAAARPDWMHKISLAVSWCGDNSAFLDALASKVDPKRTLLHLSQWRTDKYDQNYPTFKPSQRGKDFVAKATAMGFHVMPHCNAIDMDPAHAVYPMVRDFGYRSLQAKALQGWAWNGHEVLGVPNSNKALTENRSFNVMVKIHPGLAMWRSILAEEIGMALDELDAREVFIDVTLATQNLHNCLVENLTSTEGMKRLIDQIAGLRGGVAVGGEGLNEITMQGLCFAQAHLFLSHGASKPGFDRVARCPVNALLFGGLARTFGYAGLSGKTEGERLRMQVHRRLGAIPTFEGLSPAEILDPSPTIKELFELANG